MTDNHALRTLRHHVTGAIERGEKEAITAQTANMSAEQAAVIRAKLEKFNAWVDTIRGTNGWAAYRPADIPAGLEVPTNDERSALEVFDWITNPPQHIYCAYLSSDGRALTTWTGDELAQVISEKRISGGGFHYGPLTSIRAKAPNGAIWYGKGAGRGMAIKLRRAKDTHR